MSFVPTDRSQAPAAGPAPEVRVGDPVTFALANGLRVIVVENAKLPLVGIQFRADLPPIVQGERAGCTDLAGELLASGTAARDKAAIDEAVDSAGATFHTSSDGVYVACLKEHLPAMAALLQEVVVSPSFPEEEFEKVRRRMVSAVKQRAEDPDAVAEVVSRHAMFGAAHPYGEVVTERSLNSVTPGELCAWHARYIRPEKGYLVFVGDITEAEARELAEEHFGEWHASNVIASEAKQDRCEQSETEQVPGLGEVRYLTRTAIPGDRRSVFVVDRPDASQSVIRVVHPLDLHPRDGRAMNARVMDTILGGGVFNARLMANIREDKGWAYGIHSALRADRHNGSLVISVSVRTDVTDGAVAEILAEMGRMREEPVTAGELELARNHLAGAFVRGLEDPRTLAQFALNIHLYGLPPDHYRTHLQRLEAVSASDVRDAARDLLHPEGAVILVMGDKRAVQDGLARFADEVTELDAEGGVVKGVPLS